MDPASKIVEIIENDLTYLPSPEMRKVKTAFWTRFNDSPFADPTNISLSLVSRVVQDSRLARWWSQPGFKEWFSNKDEFRERVENLVHLALDTLEKILIDSDIKTASARVNAAKILMEVGKKMPPKGVREVYVDDKISKMGRSELEEFLRRNVQPVAPAELSASSTQSNLESGE